MVKFGKIFQPKFMMVNIFIGRHVKIPNDCAILKDDSNRKKKFYFRKFSNIAPLVKGEVFEKTGNHKCYPKIKFNSNKKKKIQKMVSRVTKSHHHVFHDDQNSKITFASKCKALVILGCIYKKSFLEISRSWP